MKHICNRKITALLLALVMCVSMVPTAFAAQENGYHDPAEKWMTALNRTNELDANAVVTHETFYCSVCDKQTSFTIFRTPEYTRDGQTAMLRNVKYSDGTMTDGVGIGSILDGTPGVDAYYTGFHWTKSVCDNCGTMHSNGGGYCFNKNVYYLYDCAAEFMESLDETVTYEYADSTYHTRSTKGGSYCGFCYGTHHTASSALEKHDLKTDILPQIGSGRFAIVEHCELCEYEKVSYVAAKSVIADYYGVVDGQPHTITVTDLSESGVSTQIRYGNSAESCTLSSAPNYTEEGQYAVYYEITYSYKGNEMSENGVANVWLRDETTAFENDNSACDCGCGNPDCACNGKNCPDCCEDTGCNGDHSFVLLDTVDASCLSLGYDRYLCADCGTIEKRDYVNALGHAWQGVVIREATCDTDGKMMEICAHCGELKVSVTPKGEHDYANFTIKATCTNPGYRVRECSVCGDRQITDITAVLAHKYNAHVIAATCETGGHTVHLCDGCGSSFVTDYTDSLGHSWDNGKVLTNASCTGGSVTEYTCTRCGANFLDGADANGHIPGNPATCTEAQVCAECGVVLAVPTGHTAGEWIVDKEPTVQADGSRHKECVNCGEVLETERIEKLYMSAVTDSKGEAVVGGYLVIVTDTDTANPVAGANVVLNKDDTISVRLPDGRLIDYADQTTVTVLLTKDDSAVVGMSVSVTDKNGNYCEELTNASGQVTVPDTNGKTNEDGKATAGFEDADGNRFTITVKVEDYETGRPVEDAEVSIGKTGNITVMLPDGMDMDASNRITVTVSDNEQNPLPDKTVIVKNDLGNEETGLTDENGKITVPAVEIATAAELSDGYHGAYIYGYPDGTFGPEFNMTRSEAAAIFARILSEHKGDTIDTEAVTRFDDIPENAWYAGYVEYLTGFGIVYGRDNDSFAPEEPITRAEFTAMAVRFFEALGYGNPEIMEQYNAFSDVPSGHWAAEYIRDAAINGWVKGYGDGTFDPDANITRAEVVTLMNRLLGREGCGIVSGSTRSAGVNTFSDMEAKHWAYNAVLEAANSHWPEKDGTDE